MTARITEQMITHLKSGDFRAASNLFITGQKQGIFPSDHTLTSKLVKEIGENATEKLIIAFSHYPCQFCMKGRSKCKDCEGHGHINHNIVCEQCLGLGSVRCDFCNGSGWMAIEDIPDGLRSTVLLTRARTALARIKSVLAKPVPQPSENKPSTTLKECAQVVMYLDRYMGVLENMVVASEKMNIPEGNYKNKINKIHQRCVEAAIKGKKRMREVIRCMADSARLEAKLSDGDSPGQKLAKKRTEFYKSLTDRTGIFASSKDEHPFLEKAIKNYVSKKHQISHSNQHDRQNESGK